MKPICFCLSLILSLQASESFAADSWGRKLLNSLGLSNPKPACEVQLDPPQKPLSVDKEVALYDGLRLLRLRLSVDLLTTDEELRAKLFKDVQARFASVGLIATLPEWDYAIETTWQSFIVELRSVEQRDSLLRIASSDPQKIRVVGVER